MPDQVLIYYKLIKRQIINIFGLSWPEFYVINLCVFEGTFILHLFIRMLHESINVSI